MEKELSIASDVKPEESFALIERLENFDLATVEKYELKDQVVVKRLLQAVPEGGKIIQQHQKAGEQLFKIDIPLKDLAQAKGEVGKYRAVVIKDGKIAQNAKLVPVQAGQAGAAVANVMAVAAVAVGQYYMAEIDQKLTNIKADLDKIKEFQDNEFKSKIRSLIVNISAMAEFSEEYLLNEQLSHLKLTELVHHRLQASELLEQVNLTLESCRQKDKQSDFKQYKTTLFKLNEQLFFQDTLLQILKEIARLEILFSNGQTSKESAYRVYQKNFEHANNVNKLVQIWQNDQTKKFGINLEKKRRRQEGALKVVADMAKELDKNAPIAGIVGAVGGVVGAAAAFGGAKLAGNLNKQIEYIPLEKNVLQGIKSMKKSVKVKQDSLLDPYATNVELIIDGDKVYYLPHNK